MEETMDVDLESSTNPKRFALHSSIATNFGNDYVFQIAYRDDLSAMAVSLSTNDVKLYSPLSGQYLGECKGHGGPIHQIGFAVPSMPYLLHSCSADATIRFWDTRSFRQVSCLNAASHNEIFSFAFGGSADAIVVAGTKAEILFWDWRSNKQLTKLEESHVDDVTQVHFIPGQPDKLLSGSVDGLMCIFNIAGDINDDENLESVMNVGTSIGKVGFFGEANEKLWCLTHIESLSIWDWRDARMEADVREARLQASRKWTMEPVDYFIDCHSPENDSNLWVVGGTNLGVMGYFPVNWRAREIERPEAVLVGGHSGVVRSVAAIPSRGSALQGIFGWSGGEDGRLCSWSSHDSPEMKPAWISSTLVMKSSRNSKKTRHQPY